MDIGWEEVVMLLWDYYVRQSRITFYGPAEDTRDQMIGKKFAFNPFEMQT